MELVGPPPAADPALAAWARRRQRPDNELPVPAVDLPSVLFRDETLGVGLLGWVHRAGLAMTVSLHLRHAPPQSSSRGPGMSLLADQPGAPADERFLFGLQLADGRSVQPEERPMPGRPFSPPAASDPALFRTGGRGGSTTVEINFWLTPLPPAGPTLLVLRCPAIGLPETSVGFDATTLHDAAGRVAVLWPPVERSPVGWEPRPPDPPTEGWFARSPRP